MPRGPKGEKRPADAIGNAVMIAKIATGEIEDITTDDGKVLRQETRASLSLPFDVTGIDTYALFLFASLGRFAFINRKVSRPPLAA